MLPDTIDYTLFDQDAPPTTEAQLARRFSFPLLRQIVLGQAPTLDQMLLLGDFLDCAVFVAHPSDTMTRLIQAIQRMVPGALLRLSVRARDLPLESAALLDLDPS
ncbi:hypothetical protein [Thiomonas sp.]